MLHLASLYAFPLVAMAWTGYQGQDVQAWNKGFVLLGGKQTLIQEAKLEKIPTQALFADKMTSLGYVLVEENGFSFAIEKKLTLAPTTSDVEVLLRAAEQNGFPANLRISTSPEVGRSIKWLLSNSRLGSRDSTQSSQSEIVQVGISLSCSLTVNGQSFPLQWQSSDDGKSNHWRQWQESEIAETPLDPTLTGIFEMPVYISGSIPVGFHKQLSMRILQISGELEEASKKTTKEIERRILIEYMKKYAGDSRWIDVKECRTDALPESISDSLIAAFQTAPMNRDLSPEAEADFRKGTIRNLKAKIMFTSAVRNGVGHVKRTMSLDAILRG